MPNIYTPYPETVLSILRDAGFQCGIEAKKILTNCPTSQFCAHYGKNFYGELCVRHVNELSQNTPLLPLIAIIAILLIVLVLISAWQFSRKQ